MSMSILGPRFSCSLRRRSPSGPGGVLSVFPRRPPPRACDWCCVSVRRWCGPCGRCSGWCPARERLRGNQTHLAPREHPQHRGADPSSQPAAEPCPGEPRGPRGPPDSRPALRLEVSDGRAGRKPADPERSDGVGCLSGLLIAELD